MEKVEVTSGSYIEFDYINYKQVKGHRKVKVQRISFGSTKHHPEEEWLLEAIDMDKNEERIFAMKDMTNIKKW
jgi:hypothetical protein